MRCHIIYLLKLDAYSELSPLLTDSLCIYLLSLSSSGRGLVMNRSQAIRCRPIYYKQQQCYFVYLVKVSLIIYNTRHVFHQYSGSMKLLSFLSISNERKHTQEKKTLLVSCRIQSTQHILPKFCGIY